MVLAELTCVGCGTVCGAGEQVCRVCGASLRVTRPLAGDTGSIYHSLRLAQHMLADQLFHGRYRVLRQVGVGGFGAVYEAEDTHEKRLVAIKEIGLEGLYPQQVIEATSSFNREVQFLSNLNHASIPRMYEQLTDAEHWYLVTDFIEGETLEEVLGQAKEKHLPLEQALRIGIQLCTVLDYLHSREPVVIFRDIKPTNVMLTSDQKLYLIDFGVARQYKPGQLRDTIAFGSPGYAAPEQYGRAQTTPRADVYSLGALLHQMLTGQDPSLNPFHFQPLRTIDQSLPPELEKLVAQMLEMDVEQRPESVDAVWRKLRAIESSPVVARRCEKLSQGNRSPLQPTLAPAIKPGQTFSTLGVTTTIYREHMAAVNALAWSPDSKSLASCDEQRLLHIWNAQQPAHPLIFGHQAGHLDLITDIGWSPDGSLLATASLDQTVRLWPANERPHWWQSFARVLGFDVSMYRGHTSPVKALSWSPDAQKIASAEQRTIHVWHAQTRERLLSYTGHSDEITDIAWSPDGQRIASCGFDRIVRVSHATTGKRVWAWHARTHEKPYSPLVIAWSPDSRYLACGCSNSLVYVWDIVRDSLVYIYRRHHKGAINAIAWSLDGQRIATAGNDHTVQVWGALDGKNAFPYRSHQHRVLAVAWSPDGQYIASAGQDTMVHVWRAG